MPCEGPCEMRFGAQLEIPSDAQVGDFTDYNTKYKTKLTILDPEPKLQLYNENTLYSFELTSAGLN